MPRRGYRSCPVRANKGNMFSHSQRYHQENPRGGATRAIVVRHYRTLSNANRLIMGWADAPPAPSWEADLLEVGRALRRHRITFDAIYSSALGRAEQTARYYAHQWGIPQTHSEEGLNEVNYGCLRGQCKEWAAAHYPQYKADLDFVYPEGESFRQMQQRSVGTLLAIAEQHPGETLLIVVHAGVIRGLVSHLLGLEFGDHLRARVSHRYIGDFLIRKGRCEYYDELGAPSGFVREGILRLPWHGSEVGGGAGAMQTATLPPLIASMVCPN